MKIIKTKTVFEGKYLNVRETSFVSQEGVKGTWEYIEKGSTVPFVVIFALTEDQEVVLEKNYRVPSQDWVLELPAGHNDVKGEIEAEAARRELFEETGYQSEKIIPVCKFSSSPGAARQEGSYYFAPDAVFVGGNKTDGVEEIEVIKVPLQELVGFIIEQAQKVRVCNRILAIVPILQAKGLIKL